MEKNTFLLYNDLICHLYMCTTPEDFKTRFLVPLRMLIPYSYASILFASDTAIHSEPGESHPAALYRLPPLCIPDSFTEAEENYIRYCEDDPMLWIIQGAESTLIRESDLFPEERRLHTPIYLRCYRKYDIYDTVQYSLVKNNHFLGVLTLFRTRKDPDFDDMDLFFLRSLGIHLNEVIYHVLVSDPASLMPSEDFSRRYELTPKENMILCQLLQYKNNDEIAQAMSIKETTLLKHFQNIFRKCGVSSKWELLRLYSGM